MNRSSFLSISATAVLGLALLPGSAVSQKTTLKEQLAGAWLLGSIDQTDKDGKKVQLFGAKPKGTQIFDASGQWVQIIWNSDVAKFKVNSRIKGTPEENTAAVHATTAGFGTWTVDEATKMLTVRYTGSMFPNQVDTESKRVISITGNELRISNPVTASGMKSDTVWQRAK